MTQSYREMILHIQTPHGIGSVEDQKLLSEMLEQVPVIAARICPSDCGPGPAEKAVGKHERAVSGTESEEASPYHHRMSGAPQEW